MSCGTCGGYYHCHCDVNKMKEEVRIKKMEVELLELKIFKRETEIAEEKRKDPRY